MPEYDREDDWKAASSIREVTSIELYSWKASAQVIDANLNDLLWSTDSAIHKQGTPVFQSRRVQPPSWSMKCRRPLASLIARPRVFAMMITEKQPTASQVCDQKALLNLGKSLLSRKSCCAVKMSTPGESGPIREVMASLIAEGVCQRVKPTSVIDRTRETKEGEKRLLLRSFVGGIWIRGLWSARGTDDVFGCHAGPFSHDSAGTAP
jgi:hypothetical protein